MNFEQHKQKGGFIEFKINLLLSISTEISYNKTRKTGLLSMPGFLIMLPGMFFFWVGNNWAKLLDDQKQGT